MGIARIDSSWGSSGHSTDKQFMGSYMAQKGEMIFRAVARDNSPWSVDIAQQNGNSKTQPG